MDLPRALVALVTLVGVGCQFAGGNSSPDPDAQIDVDRCPDLRLVLSLNGEPVTQSNNSVVNRITDVLELDTTGSCGRQALDLTWMVPSDFGGEKGGGGESVIRVFAEVPTATPMTISVEATDGVETATASIEVTSVGIQLLDYAPDFNDDIEGMAIAGGKLWFSAFNAGIYSLSLAEPHAAAATTGIFLREDNLSAVIAQPRHIFADGTTFWVRNASIRTSIYRFDATATNPSPTEFVLADDATGSQVDLVGYFGGGVRVTAGGRLYRFDETTFTEEVATGANAVAADDVQVWTGRNNLLRVVDGVEFDINLGEADDDIEAILLHEDEVWAGGTGVARIVGDDITRYTSVDGIRAFVADPSGDIWAASADGLWRYQRVRDRWHQIRGQATGLAIDRMQSIAIDDSSPDPVLYIGTDAGLHALTVRFSPPELARRQKKQRHSRR